MTCACVREPSRLVALGVLFARNCWCLSWRSLLSGVMLLVWFAPRLWRLIRARPNVHTLVLLFLLNFLVMRDVSCVRHGYSISKRIIERVMQIVVCSLPRFAYRLGALRDMPYEYSEAAEGDVPF